EAHSDLEPCPLCLGDGSGGPVLRALGAVPGDLASLGYDAFWCGVRAADVGAPHNRFRVFIAAYPTLDGWPRSGSARAGRPGSSGGGRAIADARRVLGAGRRGDQSSSDASGDGRHEGWAEPTRNGRGSDAAVGGASARAWGQYEPAIRRWERIL